MGWYTSAECGSTVRLPSNSSSRVGGETRRAANASCAERARLPQLAHPTSCPIYTVHEMGGLRLLHHGVRSGRDPGPAATRPAPLGHEEAVRSPTERCAGQSRWYERPRASPSRARPDNSSSQRPAASCDRAGRWPRRAGPGLARYVRHGEEDEVAISVHGVDGHDVGMSQLGSRARFAQEALGARRVRRHSGVGV